MKSAHDGGDLGERIDPQREDEGGRILDQVLRLWIEPEQRRRRLATGLMGVERAMVVFPPSSQPKVLLGAETPNFISRVRANRPIGKGEAVNLSDISEVLDARPAEIPQDSGWIALVRLGDQFLISYDFRRNRSRASRLLRLGREYLQTAQLAFAHRLHGPAIECGWAAAELATQATMHLFQDAGKRDHKERRRWLYHWSQLGNAPNSHATTLSQLGASRPASRYAEGTLTFSAAAIGSLLEEVASMLDFADRLAANHSVLTG